jgi:hypothetical protein
MLASSGRKAVEELVVGEDPDIGKQDFLDLEHEQ